MMWHMCHHHRCLHLLCLKKVNSKLANCLNTKSLSAPGTRYQHTPSGLKPEDHVNTHALTPQDYIRRQSDLSSQLVRLPAAR
jgi:hypothetical protein